MLTVTFISEIAEFAVCAILYPISIPDVTARVSSEFLSLKGQCHAIFDFWFFHQTIPPRALIHGVKPFRIWIQIRRENRLCNSQNHLPRPDRDR
jgi:hypothetical protein